MIARLKSVNFFNSFMKYFKNTSWFFGEKILRVILGFIAGVWVVRYLGPAQFGLLSSEELHDYKFDSSDIIKFRYKKIKDYF